jgi:hypothetical protein
MSRRRRWKEKHALAIESNVLIHEGGRPMNTEEAMRLRVKNVLLKHDVSQSILAKLAGINQGQMSRYLAGLDTLPRVRESLAFAVSFIESAAKRSGYPVCFHDWPKLAPYFREYKRVHVEDTKHVAAD